MSDSTLLQQAFRTLVVVSLLFGAVHRAPADVSGPLAPTICVNGPSIGSLAWNFPARASASDDVRAVKSLDHAVTQYLVCTGFNFSIPENHLISGITVENEVSVGGSEEMISDHAQRIVRGGFIGNADRASPTLWPQVEAILTHGSSQDVWGECWCARASGLSCGDPNCGNVNNADFGAALAAAHSSGTGGTARVDQVRITIYHGAPTMTPTRTLTPTITPTPTITQTWTASTTPTRTLSPTPTAAYAVCPSEPVTGCAVPGKARLRIGGNTNPSARKLKWQWQRGTLSAAELGDPTQGTSYAMCLYDDDELVAHLAVQIDDACSRSSCWKNMRGRGFAYRNRETTATGVAALTLRTGDGFASIEVKARRANLSVPMPLQQGDSLTVQLVKNLGSGLECWASRFASPALQSSYDDFEDVFP